MRLGWWSRLKFEPRRRRMAINHRSLSGHLRTLIHPVTRTFERRLRPDNRPSCADHLSHVVGHTCHSRSLGSSLFPMTASEQGDQALNVP